MTSLEGKKVSITSWVDAPTARRLMFKERVTLLPRMVLRFSQCSEREYDHEFSILFVDSTFEYS